MLVGAGLFYMDGVKFMNSAARYQLDLFHALGIPVFVTGLASIVLIYGHLYQKMWGWRLTYFLYGGYLPLRVGTILYAGWFGARSVYTIPAMLLSLVVVIGLNEYRDVYA